MINIYLHILQLDSLVQALTPFERAMAHKKGQNHPVFELDTENMKVFRTLVTQYRWCAPKIKYTESKEQIFLEEEQDKWLPIEKYNHPIIDHAISIFKTQ